MIRALVASLLCLIAPAAALAEPPAPPLPSPAAADSPFVCEAMLPPATPAELHIDTQGGITSAQGDLHATPYVFIGGNLHRDFSASAVLTLPRVAENAGLFDTNWLLLTRFPAPRSTSTRPEPFVQIEYMRWKRFDYRPELAYTWTDSAGRLVYADSSIFLDASKPHRFGIAVHDDQLTMSLDGRDVCRARTSAFFTSGDHFYFQVGAEVVHPGDRIAGTIEELDRKTDDDVSERPYPGRCTLDMLGTRWIADAAGHFYADGALTPGAPQHETGFDRHAACIGD